MATRTLSEIATEIKKDWGAKRIKAELKNMLK